MQGKKDILARALGLMALPSIKLRFGGNQILTVLAYHRVMDTPENFLFDEALISASCRDFQWQVDYLKRHCSPITFAQFLACQKGNQPLPKNPVIITFDDGFIDNYSNAFRILKAANVPATFFVTTDYLDQCETFWFDWVTYLINTMAPGRHLLAEQAHVVDVRDPSSSSRRAEVERLLAFLKQVPDEQRRNVIEELGQISGVTMPADGFAESKPMTWQQVIEMADNGMEIGSHTCSHPILSRLRRDQLDAEIRGSREALEDRLNKPVEVLAYPVGGEFAYDENVIQVTQQSGYQVACSYRSGVNHVTDLEMFALKRLHVELYTTRDRFKAMLAWPTIFG